MKKNLKFKLDLSLIFKVAIIIQVLFIAYTNIFMLRDVLDNDQAKLFVHVAKMWDTGHIVIPNWSYMASLEFDCASIFALPIYGITKNIILSFGIANIFIVIMYIFVINELLTATAFPALPRCAAIFAALIPYSFGQLFYYQMLFFGGSMYCMKTIIPLMTMTVLLYDDGFTVKKLILSILLFFLSFATAFSVGVFVLINGILPVFAVYLLCGRKICKEKILYMAATLLSVLIGIFLNKVMGLNMGMGTGLISADQLIKALSDMVVSLPEMMGGVTYANPFALSFTGLSTATKALFTIGMLLFIIVFSVIRVRRFIYSKETSSRELFGLFVMGVCAVNVFIVLMTGLGTHARYMFMAIFSLLILYTAEVSDKLSKVENGKKIITPIFVWIMMLVVMAVSSDVYVMKDRPYPNDRYDIDKIDHVINIVKDCPENSIVCLYDTNAAELLRALDMNSGKLYVTLTDLNPPDGSTGFAAHDYYESASDPEVIGGDPLVLINSNMGSITEIEEKYGYKYEEVGSYQIYTVYRKQ